MRAMDEPFQNDDHEHRLDPRDPVLGNLETYWAARAPEAISSYFPNWRENLSFSFAQDSIEIDLAIQSLHKRHHTLSADPELNDGNVSAITFFIEALQAALKLKGGCLSAHTTPPPIEQLDDTNTELRDSNQDEDTKEVIDIISTGPSQGVDQNAWVEGAATSSDIEDFTQREDDSCQLGSGEKEDADAEALAADTYYFEDEYDAYSDDEFGEAAHAEDADPDLSFTDIAASLSSTLLPDAICRTTEVTSLSSDEAPEVICEFVQSRPDIYERILMFEALDPRLLRAELLRDARLRVSQRILSDVLRDQGISVSQSAIQRAGRKEGIATATGIAIPTNRAFGKGQGKGKGHRWGRGKGEGTGREGKGGKGQR
jgi:hypothetical protein